MRLPVIDYRQPDSLDEAIGLLAANGQQAAVKAGGTDSLRLLKQRASRPAMLIDLQRIAGLQGIKLNDQQELEIGPATRLAVLVEHPLVQQRYPALSEACARVASPQIRNMGTIGGNLCLDSKCWYFNQSAFWWQARPLCWKRGGEQCYVIKGSDSCHALAAADTAPALLALEARVVLQGPGGQRTILMEDFYTGEGRSVNILEDNEIVTKIVIPQPAGKNVFVKFSRRGSIDFALASVAVAARVDSEGAIGAIRVLLGAVGPKPLRAVEAEQLLLHKQPIAANIEAAAETAARQARPLSPIWTTVTYRRQLIRALVKQALTTLLGQEG